MKIYVPSHLRNLEIVNRFCELISGYSDYYVDPSNSFNDFYNFYVKGDPVSRFITLVKPQLTESSEVYENSVKYLTTLFYSVKGTSYIFDYMKLYLPNVEIVGDIYYNGLYLSIHVSQLSMTSDETLFYDSFSEFLDALIYYDKGGSSVIVDNTRLTIEGDTTSRMSTKLINYRERS